MTAAWLKIGQELSEEKIQELQETDAREQAYQQAMLFLGYRARSESEIRQNLRKREIPEAIIEETVERLKQERLAGDKDFAKTWVDNRNTFRPRGKRALVAELKQKGLPEATIESAVESVDEETLAYEAAQKKARRLAGLEWIAFRQKLSAFLARRGFPYPVISTVVRKTWNETRTDNRHFEDKDIL